MKLSHIGAATFGTLLLNQSTPVSPATDQFSNQAPNHLQNPALPLQNLEKITPKPPGTQAHDTSTNHPLETDSRALRQHNSAVQKPDYTGLDPQGRRVNFFGDFFETPDAPPGGAHLDRFLPGNELYIQFVADTGAINPSERNLVLDNMMSDALKHPVVARLLLGDLVYETGVTGPSDPAIAKRVGVFAKSPEPLETFLILGNHDLGKKKYTLPDAYAYLDQARSGHKTAPSSPVNANPGISMVNQYYDITFHSADGSPLAQVIMLDTNVLDRDPAQKAWAEKTLQHSKAPHVIIAGHHPLKSIGPEHRTPPPFADWLSQLAHNYKISGMIFGHEHNLQARVSESLPMQFIVGAGSKIDYPPGMDHHRKKATEQSHNDKITAFGEPGFGSLKINATDSEFTLHKATEDRKAKPLLRANVPTLSRPTSSRATSEQPQTHSGTAPRWFAITASSASLLGLMAAAIKCRKKQNRTPNETPETRSLLPLFARQGSQTPSDYGATTIELTV